MGDLKPNAPPGSTAVVTREERLHHREVARLAGTILAESPIEIVPGRADAEQIFLTYAGASGDIVKTAKACGCTPQRVIELAAEGDWLNRICELIDLKKFDKYDDVGRALSRASNFVQANRWRLFLERVVRRFEEIPDENLLDAFRTFRITKAGTEVMTGFSLRVLADISTALEKCHWLLYQSLMDSPAERVARRAVEKPEEPGGETDIHARIARTLAAAGMRTPEDHAQDAVTAIAPAVQQLPAKTP